MNDEYEVELDGKRLPLVPDGVYLMQLVRIDKVFQFKEPKAVLWFRIIEPGIHFGVELPRYYRVSNFKGKGGRGYTFKVSQESELFKDVSRLFRRTGRSDRFSLKSLFNVQLKASTRTVKRDYRQRDKPENCWKSVVDELVEITDGVLDAA